jgi:hypothetical protein
MPKIEDMLPAGETVMKKSGTVSYPKMKGAVWQQNGNLYLTNQRLIFMQGKIWSALSPIGVVDIVGLVREKKAQQILLSDITSVEKGWNHITVNAAGEKHKFVFGMGGSKEEWIYAIEQAGRTAQQPSPAPGDYREEVQYQQPPTAPGAARFCPSCGQRVNPDDKFCASCGARLK